MILLVYVLMDNALKLITCMIRFKPLRSARQGQSLYYFFDRHTQITIVFRFQIRFNSVEIDGLKKVASGMRMMSL